MPLIDWKALETKAVSILLTAAIAAGFAFIQSLAAAHGVECKALPSVQAAGALGLLIRTGHETVSTLLRLA